MKIGRNFFYCCLLIALFTATSISTVWANSKQDLSLEQRTWLQKKGVLIVAGDKAFPPFEYIDKNGNYVGFNNDMIKALAKELNISVQFRPLAWEEAVRQLDEGKVDLIQGMRYSHQRSLKYNFVHPYLTMSSDIFVLKDRMDIRQLDDLAGKKVAVQKDSFSHQVIKKYPEIKLILLQEQEEGLEKLLNNQADAYVGGKLSTLYTLQKMDKLSHLKIVGKPLGNTGYGIAVGKGNSILLGILNTGLANLNQKRIDQQIREKWFGYLLSPLDNALFSKVLIAILIILVFTLLVVGIIFCWNLSLERKIRLKTSELLKRNHQLSIFNEIACATSQSLELQVVLESSLKMILQGLNLNIGMVSILDENKKKLETVFYYGYPEEIVDCLAAINSQDGFIGQVFSEGKPLLVKNIISYPLKARIIPCKLVQKYQLDSYLGIPLMVKDEVLGVLSIVTEKGYHLGEQDFEALTTVGNQIGVALDNARMYENLRKRMVELNAVREIGSKIAAIADLDQLLEKTLEVLKESFGYEICIIGLVDRSNERMTIKAVGGNSAYTVIDNDLRMGRGISGWVAQQGEAVIIGDVSTDPRYFDGFAFPDGRRIQSVISVPIKFRDEVIGLLHMESTQKDAFGEDDLFIVTTLAQDLAVAIKNVEATEEIKEDFLATLSTLATLIELKDPYTGGHSQKVKEYSLAIANELGLSHVEKEDLEIAASLHDIGKIGIDNSILNKPGKLTDDEYLVIKNHPLLGESSIKYIKKLQKASKLVRHHHEHYNGAGYPDSLAGNDIPLGARIIGVADAFEAMTSDRVYRKALTMEKAIAILQEEQGRQFCPQCVDAFLAYLQGKKEK